MSQTSNNNSSCLGKTFSLLGISLLILGIICCAIFGWSYYKLTQTDDLAIAISEKLSRPNKYQINIDHFKNTLPLITAENVTYDKISNVSSLSVKVGELIIYPDFSAPGIGTHSFLFNDASLYLKTQKFFVNSSPITLSGRYNPKYRQIVVASSTFEAFHGKLYISGNVDTTKRPNPYDFTAKLVYVKLEDILEGTKHKGLFTGDVYGTLRMYTHGGKDKSLLGEASLSVTNGTYCKPELFEKVCNALHKVGLRSKLHEFASEIASGSFSLTGDFKIKNNSYETQNCEAKVKFGTIKFSGTIGPGSAINGAFRVKIKHYSDFEIKAEGPDSKHMKYEISDSDKARVASILLREATKSTEESIKDEGRRFNDKLNDAYEDGREAARDIRHGTTKELRKIGHKIRDWFN